MTALRAAASWARDTFGPNMAGAHSRKAEAEWAEFLEVGTTREAVEEAADVVIALAAFCDSAGYDLEDLVAAKVRVNRARVWERQADGTFQHR